MAQDNHLNPAFVDAVTAGVSILRRQYVRTICAGGERAPLCSTTKAASAAVSHLVVQRILMCSLACGGGVPRRARRLRRREWRPLSRGLLLQPGVLLRQCVAPACRLLQVILRGHSSGQNSTLCRHCGRQQTGARFPQKPDERQRDGSARSHASMPGHTTALFAAKTLSIGSRSLAGLPGEATAVAVSLA